MHLFSIKSASLRAYHIGNDYKAIIIAFKNLPGDQYLGASQLANLGGPLAEVILPAAPVAEQPPIFNEWVAELVALGAAIASNCEPCFRYHHRKAVELGISQDDMVQAVNVALKVKEQQAKAMVSLAQKLLVPEATKSGGCCGGEDKPGCC